MSIEHHTILEQVRRNSVAIISLIIAVSSLSYNTWRNEKTEENRNLRYAAFEMLLKLGELQQNIFYLHYYRGEERLGNPRIGWAYVLTVQDLAEVLGPPVFDTSKKLLMAWGQNWDRLGEEQESADTILEGIECTRAATIGLLKSLDS